MELKNLDIQDVIEITIQAGDEILEIYNDGNYEIETKNDDSPLTRADKESNYLITKELTKIYPEIPIISEESKGIPFIERANWEYFWLVDPLDGTKEFIKRNGEFTVNVALIQKNRPVAGVIFAPALGDLYYAQVNVGVFKRAQDKKIKRISVNKITVGGRIAVRSRSHASEEELDVFKSFDITNTISVGSSLKFCMVAEGKAQLYYRHGPTWEWDTAAGHIIAECAGATVTGLSYNKEIIKHDSFLISALN